MDGMFENAEFVWAKETVLKNFPNLQIEQISKLGEGWMSRAYLINNKLVFRFPKGKSGADDTEKEIKVLPLLKKYITLSIPELIYVGTQDNGYPFVGYKILPGEPMDEQLFDSLAAETNNILAIQIAEFINQIRSFHVDLLKGLKVREDDFYQEYLNLFKEVQHKAFPIVNKQIQNYLTFRFTSYLENKHHFFYTPKLLHSDLSLDHLLFDKNRQELTGIIDFGDMRIGDPDYEYVYLLEECGEEFTKKVMENRQEENCLIKIEKVSFFLTADNVRLLLEGIKRNSSEMVDESMEAIQNEMNNHQF